MPLPDPISLAAAMDPENGYRNVRVLADGTIVGTHKLLYTTALMVDIDDCGYGKRYCYPTEQLAVAACEALTNANERPMEGFVASRGSVHKPTKE